MPGLIDVNTHINWGTQACLDPDLLCVTGGVTTNVDAGTMGGIDFVQFKTFIAEPARSLVLAFINASCLGMQWTPEYFDLETLWVPDGYRLFMTPTHELIPVESGLLKGVTLRVFDDRTATNDKTMEAVALAKDVAMLAQVPLMLQLESVPEGLVSILDTLTTGDVVSRIYAPGVGDALLSTEGKAALDAARARGVLLDVGHGRCGFDFDIAKRALDADILPDTISTGLYGDCINDIVFDLPTTLSKFMHLGMDVVDLIDRATHRPAHLLGMAAELGDLRIGSRADITVLALDRGEFSLADSTGRHVQATQRLRAVQAVCDGRPIPVQPDAVRSDTTWLPRV